MVHRLRSFSVLDGIRAGLLALGLLFVVTGLLPTGDAEDALTRIAPLLLFLAGIIVLVELTKSAEVFDVIAAWLARVGRGHYPALFALCVAFASLTAMFLNLDTTAVLLTPVMLALAARTGIAALPLAMTTVWLANAASLLLPVSNLTNLLAADRIALAPAAFAGRMWAAQLAAVAVTVFFLWLFYWRAGARGVARYEPPEPVRVRDGVLAGVTATACLVFVGCVLAGIQVEFAAVGAAVPAVAAFAWRDRAVLRPSLIPWQLLIFVIGLFLVVPTVSRYGLQSVMTTLIGTDGGFGGSLRAALSGAGLANILNNLPAYAVGELAVPAGNSDQLLSLLAGVNVGPLVTPWASLATLLWFEWCRRHGLEIPLRRFMLHGACVAVVALPVTVAALLVTG
ncbi:MAG: SLC13 family permease [Streptosporangiaceae bacterium]